VRDKFAHALPDTTSLQLDTWHLDDAHAQITLLISSIQAAPRCPGCHAPARHVHSCYTRTLADLPWSGYAITWQLRVRKLFCSNTKCPRRIFTKRLPGLVAPWARRTLRLTARLLAIGLALGEVAGARLSRSFGLTVSRNTLLRVIRRTPCPAITSPQVLSVDDFAPRKHHTYGTLLLDLEQRRPLALLPDREAATVAHWLQAHPGVKVFVRDRAEAYAEAARLGAPTACQVANRFHLLQNLADTLTQVFTAHASQLARVTPPRAAPTPVHDPTDPAAAPGPASGCRSPRPSRPPRRHAWRASGGPNGGPTTTRSGRIISGGGHWTPWPSRWASVDAPCSVTSRARRSPSGRRGMAVTAAFSIRTKPCCWLDGIAAVGMAGISSGRSAARAFGASTGLWRSMSDVCGRRRGWRPGSAGAISRCRW
jgi:hypothetical protein